MSKEEIQKLVELRQSLIVQFERLNEWQRDRNAIMKQVDHAQSLSGTIKEIDSILKEHVTFSK